MTELVSDLMAALPVTAVGNLALAGFGLILIGLGILGWVLAGRRSSAERPTPTVATAGQPGYQPAAERPVARQLS